MKYTYILTLILCAFSTSTYASDSDIEGVKKLTVKPDGSYKVKCDKKNRGIIFFEEEQMCAVIKVKRKKKCEEELNATEEDATCAFSKGNDNNQCKAQNEWTVEDAAEYICQE